MAEHARIFVSIHDIEHVKLHIWEMERLIEDMREERNPMADRAQHLLDRFVKADLNQDRY
jgi:hypothetical protein